MPLLGSDGGIDILDGDAPALLHVIQRHIVFERIAAGNVIVVAILKAPEHAAGLIFPTCERFELDLDKAVGDARRLLYAPRKGGAPRLFQDIWAAWRRCVSFDFPDRRTFSGDATSPAVGN